MGLGLPGGRTVPAAPPPPGIPLFPPGNQGWHQPLILDAGDGMAPKGLKEVKELLQQAGARRQSGDPWWWTTLWSEVARMVSRGEVDETVRTECCRQGFDMGSPSACKAPDLETLTAILEVLGGPASGGAGLQSGGLGLAQSSSERFGVGLAMDMKRAGPEIYRSLVESNLSVRDWLNQFYQGNRRGAGWIDLWNAAVTVDFKVAEAKQRGGMQQVALMLATDDLAEVYLRRLASYVYGKRTGDWSGANYMLAVKAPGSEVDIAPSWMISEATNFSKSEYQRTERVKALNKQGKGDGKGRGKGDGKGKQGRGQGGGGSPPTQG